MKLFISVDMEGIHGTTSWSDLEGPSRAANYERAWLELSWILRGLAASPRNAEIEEICVCDSHARGEGIPFKGFGDPRVTWVRGYPRPFYMLEGLDESYAGLLLVGYHASIGTQGGVMDHSYSASCIYRVRLDGVESGETEINARLAGFHGVPVCFISGDDILESQLEGRFDPMPVYVRTKEGLGRFAGKMYAPERLEGEFVEGATRSLDRLSGFRALSNKRTTKLEIELSSTAVADAVAVIPGIVRTSGRSIRYSSGDFRDIYRMIHAVAMLGGKFAAFT
ncbi:MAG TPA: M55 family metallopeptidase [Rectinemataceae bacterium]|nr:M55 family metallopeptidase [Rectinemataceae bacterium]